jgi:hypothetical protein
MELLSNETVREWLLCRSEPSLPATVVETAFPLRAYLQFDSFSVTCDYLVKPLGVVNGILLGYVLGDPYSFALSQNWGPMVHPACRRFVLNLETQEFLEFHWYLHNDTLLANWMKFPTSKHRLRYFVLYEAPPPGKIPFKLLSSVELVLQRTESGKHQMLSASDDLFTLLPPVEQSLQNFPSALEFATLLLGTFSGTFRWTQYDPDTLTVTEDELYAYSVTICTRTHAEDIRLRELRRLCYPNLQVDSPVPEFYNKKYVESNENKLESSLLNNVFEDQQINFSLSCNDTFIPSSFCSGTSVELQSDANVVCHTSELEKCRTCSDNSFAQNFVGGYRNGSFKRGRSSNENTGLLWTHSWNFAPQEYFDSYSSNTSSTDNSMLERKVDPASAGTRYECDYLFVNDFFDVAEDQVPEHCTGSRNESEFSSFSSMASEYNIKRTLSGISLSQYWSNEDDILTSVELPCLDYSIWDVPPQDSEVPSLPRTTENDIATIFLNDGDWILGSDV